VDQPQEVRHAEASCLGIRLSQAWKDKVGQALLDEFVKELQRSTEGTTADEDGPWH
jgi:hypothetical protein